MSFSHVVILFSVRAGGLEYLAHELRRRRHELQYRNRVVEILALNQIMYRRTLLDGTPQCGVQLLRMFVP